MDVINSFNGGSVQEMEGKFDDGGTGEEDELGVEGEEDDAALVDALAEDPDHPAS